MAIEVEKLKDKPLPCPLCERRLGIRISKTGKPYVVCDDCGVQMFVRYPAGFERLADKIRGKFGGIF